MKLYDEWERIANQTIPAAGKVDHVIKQNYTTGDIVKDVLDTYNETKDQLKAFAPTLRGPDDKTTCSNIWTFIKVHLQYKVDPSGVQWVRTPARLWQDDIGDCKSFSLFAASLLHCLGIPGFFRFVSFSDNSALPTHVYVVATPTPDHHYPIDAVYTQFNRETPFKSKTDYDMSTLYTLSGIGEVPKVARPGELVIPVAADGTTTDELLSAAIVKQRLELEQAMTARVAGIGATTVSIYDDAIQMVNNDIARMQAGISGVWESGMYEGEGVGSIFSKIAKVVTAPVKLVAKGVTAVAKGAVAVAKTTASVVRKVVTLPFRGIAEVAIPKAGMSFLYTFIKNPDVLAKLPPVVVSKREKQMKLAHTICVIIDMKEDHFYGIARNGIMKSVGKTPEAYLSEMFKMAISGIGIIPALIAVAGPLMDLLKKILSLFGKGADVDKPEESVPDSTDFDGYQNTPAAAEVATTLQQDGQNNSALSNILATVQASTEAIKTVQQQFAASQVLPAVQPAAMQPVSVNTNGQMTYGNPADGGTGYADAGNVIVRPQASAATTPASPPAAGNNNNMLLIGGGLAALYLLTRKH